MKRPTTFKTILITSSFLSLFAFLFVNFCPNNAPSPRPFSRLEMTQTPIEGEFEGDSRDIHVPDVSVLGRIWEIAQGFLNGAS